MVTFTEKILHFCAALFDFDIRVTLMMMIWIFMDQTYRKYIAQKMKFSIKDFFSKCDQILSFLRIWSHLLNKFLMENFILCAVVIKYGGTNDITNYTLNRVKKIKSNIKND